MLMAVVFILAWLALPVGLICVVDDWFFRPRRQLTVPPLPDSPFISFAYRALPFLMLAVIATLLTATRLDFGLVLLLVVAVSGIVWGIDSVFLKKKRIRQSGQESVAAPEPATVENARSFFKIALVVLILRSFIFEPFRIPSDSMMPTLVDGDFIVVNKYAYGLRLPGNNTKIMSVGEPRRGDVVVFRYPKDPATNYIKRLVGLPGDRVEVKDDRLFINGEAVRFDVQGTYDDGCYINMQIATEKLGEHEHQTIFCPVPLYSVPVAPSTCNRKGARGYFCNVQDLGPMFGEQPPYSATVPANSYLMVGDNRDNSADGREWGFVPEANLVGRASRIWFNLDLHRSWLPNWGRIGQKIQ